MLFDEFIRFCIVVKISTLSLKKKYSLLKKILECKNSEKNIT